MLAISEANGIRLLFVSETADFTAMDYIHDAVLAMEDNLFEGQAMPQVIWKKLRGFEIPHRNYPYTLHGGKFLMIDTPMTFTYPANPTRTPFAGRKHGTNSYPRGLNFGLFPWQWPCQRKSCSLGVGRKHRFPFTYSCDHYNSWQLYSKRRV